MLVEQAHYLDSQYSSIWFFGEAWRILTLLHLKTAVQQQSSLVQFYRPKSQGKHPPAPSPNAEISIGKVQLKHRGRMMDKS